MIRGPVTERPRARQRWPSLVAALGFAAACCAAREQAGVREIAEAWASAVRDGEAERYVATLDLDRVRYLGRIVSTDPEPYAFEQGEEARAVGALFAATRVVDGVVKVVEVMGEEAVIAVRLELYDTYSKGGDRQFRYRISTRVRLRTATSNGERRIIAITEEFPGGKAPRALGSFALPKYLHSDLYDVRSERSRAGPGRSVEVGVVVDRRKGTPMIKTRRTIDDVRSPLGSPMVEMHTVLLDARGRRIENAEEVE